MTSTGNNNFVLEIEDLLKRYYDGDTTPEDEERLACLFKSSTDLPHELEAEKKVFLSLTASPFILPEGMDEEIEHKFNLLTDAKPKVKPSDSSFFERMKTSSRLWGGIAAAAVVLVIALLWHPGGDRLQERESFLIAETTTLTPPPHIVPDDKAKLYLAEAVLTDMFLELETASMEMAETEDIIINDTETLLSLFE